MIVSTLTSGWGDQARGLNRYFAFDKRNGTTVWVSSPQPKHYDTNYSTPIVLTAGGRRLLVVGGSDGTFYGLEAHTGRSIWQLELSKRAILTSAAYRGTTLYLSHSEENLDTNEMGMVGALDAAVEGKLTPDKLAWRSFGIQGGFASPVADGERLYMMDNGAVLMAFDLASGKRLWEKPLGTIQKASPVLADGKLYTGTENGKFYIIKPAASGPEILDEDQLGTEAAPEAIIASPAVARGRVYVASMDALYAIGPKGAPRAAAKPAAPKPADERTRRRARGRADRALRVAAEAGRAGAAARAALRREGPLRARGACRDLHARRPEGRLRRLVLHARPPTRGPQAGLVKATAGALSATARVRVIPPLPWSFDFEGTTGEAPPPYWINSTGKFFVRDHAGTKALMKRNDIPLTKRGRLFFGPRRLLRLHRRGGRALERAAPPDGRRRRDRAALRAGAVRQRAEARAAPVAGEPGAHGRGAVRLEAGDLVPGQAARREPARTARPRCRARRGRPPSPSPRRGRSTTSTACRTGRAPPASTPTRRPRSSSTTSRSPRTSEEDASRVREPLPLAAACPSPGRASGRRRAHPRGRPERRLADVGRHARPQHGLRHEGPARSPGTSQSKKNVQVGGGARLAELRQPGRGGRQGVRRHQQRGPARSQAAGRPRRADGLPRVGRRVPLADHPREAGRRAASNDWPYQGVCSSPLVEGDRLYYVTNRCELLASTPRASATARTTGPTRTRS